MKRVGLSLLTLVTLALPPGCADDYPGGLHETIVLKRNGSCQWHLQSKVSDPAGDAWGARFHRQHHTAGKSEGVKRTGISSSASGGAVGFMPSPSFAYESNSFEATGLQAVDLAKRQAFESNDPVVTQTDTGNGLSEFQYRIGRANAQPENQSSHVVIRLQAPRIVQSNGIRIDDSTVEWRLSHQQTQSPEGVLLAATVEMQPTRWWLWIAIAAFMATGATCAWLIRRRARRIPVSTPAPVAAAPPAPTAAP